MAAHLKIEGEMARARFLSRTSRFSVLAELEDARSGSGNFECHLPNPGRLKELLLRPAKNSERRKTKFDVFAVVTGAGTVVVDSRIPNQIVGEALNSGDIPHFSGYKLVRSEPAYGKSRLDFLLAGDKLWLVEVKSCTLVKDGIALFPDAPPRGGAATFGSWRGPSRMAIGPVSSSSSRGKTLSFSYPTTRQTLLLGTPSGLLQPVAWR